MGKGREWGEDGRSLLVACWNVVLGETTAREVLAMLCCDGLTLPGGT